MQNLARESVTAFRLSRHCLDQRASSQDLAKVLGAIGGVQAQVMGAASLALWARVAGLAAPAIDDSLLNRRTVVRTWAMRGTLHLLPAGEFLVYLAGLRAARRSREEWMERLGLDGKLADRAVSAVRAELADGPLTRRELSVPIRHALGKKVTGAVDQALAGTVEDGCARVVLEYASARGVACLGPSRGQELLFVRVDQWLPEACPAPPEEQAEEHLLRRYLRAFGPATVADFAYWSGMQAADAASIMNRLKEETSEVRVNGRQEVVLRDDVQRLRQAAPVDSVRLLPNFDTFLLGHKDKASLLDAARYKDVYRKAGWIAATILADGRIIGTWTRKKEGRRLVVQLQPFVRLSRTAIRALESEAADLARFFGLQSSEVHVG